MSPVYKTAQLMKAVKFEVIPAVTVKNTILCYLAPVSLAEAY
jgi:hypothetical protein